MTWLLKSTPACRAGGGGLVDVMKKAVVQFEDFSQIPCSCGRQNGHIAAPSTEWARVLVIVISVLSALRLHDQVISCRLPPTSSRHVGR